MKGVQMKRISSLRALIAMAISALFLSACGGGSTSSGGSPGQTEFAQAGVYNGSRTFDWSSAGTSLFEGEGPMSVTVTGVGLGQQAVIASREFSGTSSITPGLSISIPSGPLRYELLERGVFCDGSTRFDGQFSGQTVSGTETGSWTCPNGEVVTLSGTFVATLGAALKAGSQSLLPDMPLQELML